MNRTPNIKYWLDDLRVPPDASWVHVFCAPDLIAYLQLPSAKYVSVISLDHDLGDDKLLGTGYDVLKWIEEKVYTDSSYIPPEIRIHSANCVGVRRMYRAVLQIEKIRYSRTKIS